MADATEEKVPVEGEVSKNALKKMLKSWILTNTSRTV